MPPDLAPYAVLLTAVTEGRLSGDEFVTVYMALFKGDQVQRPIEIYEVLNDVFGAADCFYEDADPGNPLEVGEAALRKLAATSIARLEQFV